MSIIDDLFFHVRRLWYWFTDYPIADDLLDPTEEELKAFNAKLPPYLQLVVNNGKKAAKSRPPSQNGTWSR